MTSNVQPLRRPVAAFVVGLGILLASCQPSDDTAKGAAQNFVDKHYVRIDLAASIEHCVGVALQKVGEEQRLVGDQQIDESTRPPRITYELKEERKEDDGSVSFLYDAMIHVDGADSFSRRWLVTTRREGSVWKVSNFSEFE